MNIVRFATASACAAVLAATPALLSASDEPAPRKDAATATSSETHQFSALKGIKAVPMSARELDTVKGQHVHFLTPGNNTQHGVPGLQLAGDVKTENNWSNEWGGTDGHVVAPSYKGLCVAHSVGGIFIPTMGPITTQCPAR